MADRELYLGASPEDAARIVRDRAIPAPERGSEVEVVALRSGLPHGAAVGVRVDDAQVRNLGGGRYAVDHEAAEAGVTRAYQPWHVDVEPDMAQRWRGYLREDARGLRNLLDVESYDELRPIEDNLVEARLMELAERPVPQTHDLAHMEAIHGRLFEDVYPWAGETRTVNMGRPDGPGFLPWDQIEEGWRDLAETARAVQQYGATPGVSREAFADGAGLVYHAANTIHAFREGNGRTQRQWMDDLARPAGYRFDWQQVAGPDNDRVSQAAREGDLGPMRDMFRAITERVPAAASSTSTTSAAVEAARLAQRANAQSPTQATAPSAGTATRGQGAPTRPQPRTLDDRAPGVGG